MKLHFNKFRIVLFFSFLFSFSSLYAQQLKMFSIGNVTRDELEMQYYEKDSTANTLILAEQSLKRISSTNTFSTNKVYKKIKFFNKEETNLATVSFLVPNRFDSEITTNSIKAITYNIENDTILKTPLEKENIYVSEINSGFYKISFTMPNVLKGSVIEYEYEDYSFDVHDFKGWLFQTDVPKKLSRVLYIIPSNFRYKTYLIGNLKLTNSQVYKNQKCKFDKKIKGKCDISLFQIKDIPALIFEDHTSSPKNYLSRISLKFSKALFFNGIIYRNYPTWELLDKAIIKGDEIGKKAYLKNYFRRRMPEEIKIITDTLAKAKKIYYFIQNNYSTNAISDKNQVMNDFKNKYGSGLNINMALLNSLNSMGIESNFVLLSTRNNGIINKLYPEDGIFNYIVLRTVIKNKEYFLDASDKLTPFGITPFGTLNGDGRILNLKGDSFWKKITPSKRTYEGVIINLTMNENGDLNGQIKTSSDGYLAIKKRKHLENKNLDTYKSEIYDINANFEITSYEISNQNDLEKPIQETFKISLSNDDSTNDIVFINPFIYFRQKTNIFKLEERTYPVDFGYAKSTTHVFSLEVPKTHIVKSLPKNVAFKLPNDGGRYIFNIEQINNKINMNSMIILNKPVYTSEEYPYLKEFYRQIIKTQNSLITLEKI